MTAPDPRLHELIDKVEAALAELKAYAGAPAAPAGHGAPPEHKKAVEAFADEAFRDRDA